MEILRIVAMMMIIMLHYLDKGGILKDLALKMGFTGNLAWLIEAFCMVSVNIYVLISGYFLSRSESEFKIGKVALIWAQVLLYSWIITIVFAIVTRGGFNFENGIYDFIPLILPVTGGHYWFATIYILLYLFFPFLNMGIKAMDKKQLKTAVLISVAVFSIWNTILPFTQPLTDREGMDICWFVCLYLTAAYIRKYSEDFKLNRWLYLLFFALSCTLVFALAKGLLLVDVFVGKLGGYAGNFYPYNSFLIYFASVCLFVFAMKTNVNAKGFIAKAILFASQGTFGVYLLHEHKLLRYLWPKWFKVASFDGKPIFVLHAIGTVLAIFIVGITVDFIRRLIFNIFTTNKNKGSEEQK